MKKGAGILLFINLKLGDAPCPLSILKTKSALRLCLIGKLLKEEGKNARK
jgi:hypothetical protein